MIACWNSVRRAFIGRIIGTLAGGVLAVVTATAHASNAQQPARKAPAETRPVVLVLGDSLSAEYGLARDSGWVKLLEQRLERQTSNEYSVVNASISGETTSGGLTRLPALLKNHRPSVVVIELGANDGLRGLPLDLMRKNLRAMVDACRASGARVLLVGMRIPPNYGRDYAERFFGVFAEIARETKVGYAPFILDGLAEDLSMFQADRIHPTEQAQGRMLDNIWPHLQPLIAARRS
jgi:acyl-CoA thioesterase I